MVGGRTLSGNLDSAEQTPAGSKEGAAGLGARQATYGQHQGESATGKGKQVISDAEQGRVIPSSMAVAGLISPFQREILEVGYGIIFQATNKLLML